MSYFDAGVFLTLSIIAFVCIALSRQHGGMLLIMSVMSFTVLGLLILAGNDVASFTLVQDSTGPPINQTTYFIGNGQSDQGHPGQLLFGYVFISLALISGAMLADAILKGQFFSKS